jgi:replication factor C small subunit
MTELSNSIWVEKYRPNDWDSLICENKIALLNYLKNPLGIPSFILHSSTPGTGKTTVAKLLIGSLQCDYLAINASDERGVETIREKVSDFSRSLSSNANSKRCIFMDEADGLTKIAQDSLRNLMEEYSGNVFFVITANDVSKIIEPIQSRCVIYNFDKPNKADVFQRLSFICEQEKLTSSDAEITDLINRYYPDMRSMVKSLQNAKIENKTIGFEKDCYEDFLVALKKEDIQFLYNKTYSSDFDIYGFNKWLFTHLFLNINSYKNIGEIALCCAEVEKGYTIGVNAPVIFLANMAKIAKLMKG